VLWKQYLPLLLFAAFGLPLALQDIKDSSVSIELLAVAYLVWSASTCLSGESFDRAAAAAILMLLGSLLLLVLPGRLGEADIVFMSGMALFFPFWSLMIALALGCIGALAVFAWLSRGGRADTLERPLPFLPSLYWGGLTVVLGGIRF
jgi:hypothetical protein